MGLCKDIHKDKQAQPNHINKVPIPTRCFKAEAIMMVEHAVGFPCGYEDK